MKRIIDHAAIDNLLKLKFSIREIAEALKISRSTVRKRAVKDTKEKMQPIQFGNFEDDPAAVNEPKGGHIARPDPNRSLIGCSSYMVSKAFNSFSSGRKV